MRERTAQLLLLCGGLIVSCLLAEAAFYLLNRAAATYPVVVYATDKPGTELLCYDDKFQGKADWDLRLGHPYRELTYRSNMDFDSTLVALDPLAVSSDAIQDEATGGMNAAIHDLMHYREAFFRRSYGSVLDAIPSQTLRFFAARKLRDKISEETLAWYRRTYSDENQGWGHTRTLLRDIADFCRARDIKFTVIQFPLYYRLDDYPLADIHQQLGEFATSEGIEWIDLLPLFAGKDERDYWV